MLKNQLLAIMEENKDYEFFLPSDLKSKTVNSHLFNSYLKAFLNNNIDFYQFLYYLPTTYDSLKTVIDSRHHSRKTNTKLEEVRKNIGLLWNAVLTHYNNVLTEDDLR